MIGKTYSTVSVADIFSHFKETEVLSSVFPEITTLPCAICSPLRVDNRPSFGLYLDNKGHVRFKDFATGDKGNLLNLLCKYWKCSFKQMLFHLENLFIDHNTMVIKTNKPVSGKIKIKNKSTFHLEVKIRPWENYDIEYWESYGCNIQLLKYCEVYPVSHKIIYKDGNKHVFAAPKYSYVFVEHKEGKTTKKLYSPFATKYKWLTDNDSSVIGLWTKVPQKGSEICICSSLKDAVALWSNSGIPCVYIQGEAFNMSDTAINELKKRFTTVFICLDNDKWGIEDAEKLTKQTGFINIELPHFEGGKDISDFYKLYGAEKFKETIIPLFTAKKK